MAGWRNYMAAGLTALGLSFLPYTVSTGTGGSNDSLDKNSKLEKEVQVDNSVAVSSQPQDNYSFDFEKEKLDNGGVAYKAHVINPSYNDPISSCVCKDVEGNGIFSDAVVYNSSEFSITTKLGTLTMNKGNSRFYIKEFFDLDVGLSRNGEAFIEGVDKYDASLYYSENASYMPSKEKVDSDGETIKTKKISTDYTRWDTDSRKESIEKMGETGANKARRLAYVCQEFSEGNKNPVEEFLKRESTSTFFLRVRNPPSSAWEEGRPRQNVVSDKVWNTMYVPGTIVNSHIH